MIKKLEQIDWLLIESDDGNVIWTITEDDGRCIPFHVPSDMNVEELFDFGRCVFDNRKFFEVLKGLDPTMFMTVDEIKFILTEDDYDNLYSILEYEFMDFEEELGKNLYFENWIIINLHAVISRAIAIHKEDGNWNYFANTVNAEIIKTLLHELYHSKAENPLYSQEIGEQSMYDLECMAEEFSQKKFKEITSYEDCVFFKIPKWAFERGLKEVS